MRTVVKSSGGLGAQILTIAYCIWLKKNKGRKTIIQFTEQGISHRSFVTRDLLSSIDLRVVKNSIESNTRKQNTKLTLPVVHRSNRLRFKFRQLFKHILLFTRVLIYKPNLSLEEIDKAKAWTRVIDGYFADLRVLKEVWSDLSQLILQQRPINFISNAGSKNNLSVHWRLGDYANSEANLTHGVISVDDIIKQIQHAISEHPIEKVLVFSDSPETVESYLGKIDLGVSLSIAKGDIWSDMIHMAESRFFIGSHSSVSILITFALFERYPDAVVYLPDEWFKRIPDGFEKGIDNCHPKSIFPSIKLFDATLH